MEYEIEIGRDFEKKKSPQIVTAAEGKKPNRAALGAFPQDFFDRAYKARDELNRRQADVLRYYFGEEVTGDLQGEVYKRHRHKSKLVKKKVNSGADVLKVTIFPDTKYSYVNARQGSGGPAVDILDALWWHKLENEVHFSARARDLIRDVLLTFGVLTKAIYERVVDPDTGRERSDVDFQPFFFTDFVLDPNAPDPESASKVVCYCVSKDWLRTQAENGNFDKDAVKYLLATEGYGAKKGESSDLQTVVDENAGNLKQDGSGKVSRDSDKKGFWVYEFWGEPDCEELGDVPSRQFIASCNGVCLAAEAFPTPDGMDPFVYFRGFDMPGDRLHGECLAEDVFDEEFVVNAMGTLLRASAALQVMPPVIEGRRTAEEYMETNIHVPGNKWRTADNDRDPHMLEYNPNLSPAMALIGKSEQSAGEVTGVTDMAVAGASGNNGTATAASLDAQATQIRLGELAKRFEFFFTQLNRKMFRLFKANAVDPEPVVLPGGKAPVALDMNLLREMDVVVSINGMSVQRQSRAQFEDFGRAVGLLLSNPATAAIVKPRAVAQKVLDLTPATRNLADELLMSDEEMATAAGGVAGPGGGGPALQPTTDAAGNPQPAGPLTPEEMAVLQAVAKNPPVAAQSDIVPGGPV